ncbi:MAG TPA: hypothetical protein VKA18_03980 [Alphaproteobacteria bacterium]|nr:hypothetical protein [Alphaproteobacteria bacterium]
MNSENKVDGFFSRVKNHPVLAVVVIVAVCISGLASFTESISTLSAFFFGEPEHASPSANPMPAVSSQPGGELDGEYHYRLLELTNDGCLFFKWDSSNIASLPEPAATNQTMMLMNLDKDKPVVVVGYGDRGNALEHSFSIGERRGGAARDMLVREYGYDTGLISVVSKGLGNTPQIEDYLCGARIEQ